MVIIGIAGGSGSGKSTLASEIIQSLGSDNVLVIQHDSYYRDRSHIPPAERENINYDHPDAIETSLLVSHLKELRKGRPVEIPIYDFITHTRKSAANTTYPKKFVFVEGIFILVDEALRQLMDIKVYVDTDDDIRLIRRLQRDIIERGRTLKSVINQYKSTVKPMHKAFVEPSKRYADIIVPWNENNLSALESFIKKIKSVLV